MELLVAVKGREWPTIPSVYVQRLFISPKYNAATSIEELGSTNMYRRSKRDSKRVEMPNLWCPNSQIGIVGCREGKGKAHHTFGICPKALHGSQIQFCKSIVELGSTKTYRRSKRASKRVEVPNLAQAAKSELLVAVKGRERSTIPSIYAQRLFMGPKYNSAKA